MRTLSELISLLQTGAGYFDDDEAVDELTHALQAGGLAVAGGADDELVAAAVLHDIGRLPAIAAQYPDLAHEHAGARACADLFSERVTWLIAAHVPAKRFLLATDPAYGEQLSDVSVRSLATQGGPLGAAEAAVFAAHPWAADAAALRRWDDLAKVPGAPAPSLEDLAPILARASQLTDRVIGADC